MTDKLNSEGFEETNYLTKKYPKTPNIYVIKETKIKHINTPEAAFILFIGAMENLDREKEHFLCASVNTQNGLKSLDIISIGSLNANIVHPREVFYAAIANRAASIIVAHNHPSGNTAPSQNDLDITWKLKDAGKVLGIELNDHIIIGNDRFDGYMSMKEQGVGGWQR